MNILKFQLRKLETLLEESCELRHHVELSQQKTCVCSIPFIAIARRYVY
jgi:hypothetical protein